jgi:transcription antitermination protein NusB
MATAREIRRLAFQALYQLDARGAEDVMSVRESMDSEEEITDDDRDQALELAVAAFDNRAGADREMVSLAPEWPVHRQAAVDRAILRLAHHEMVSGRTPPKIAVNEAVELAKEFSTERSPPFINALLDKVLKRVLAERDETGQPSPT